MMARLRLGPAPGTVPALFLHIQKTAGTSIVHLARQYYGESLSSHGEFWGRTHEQLRDIRFISGHIGHHFAAPLMKGRYTFTFFREPAERILSFYYFCQDRDPGEYEIYRMAREMTLPEFLHAGLTDPMVRMHIWNNQTWQLAHGYDYFDTRAVDDYSEADLLRLGKTHLAEFDHVGFTETLESDTRKILKALGIPKPKALPHMNASTHRKHAAEHSPEVLSLLSQLTALDRELYRFARNELPCRKISWSRMLWRWK